MILQMSKALLEIDKLFVLHGEKNHDRLIVKLQIIHPFFLNILGP